MTLQDSREIRRRYLRVVELREDRFTIFRVQAVEDFSVRRCAFVDRVEVVG